MPSPFPGMDPFIERFEWDDFHITTAVKIADFIQPQLPEHYVARLARREYMERGHRTSPFVEEERESYVYIRDLRDGSIVTRIEILSPLNKQPGTKGHEVYMSERSAILDSPANLVELDLLRGGKRLPIVESIPDTEYRVIVSRPQRRPRSHVYSWPLESRMPKIEVPLRDGEAEVTFDLQSIVNRIYDIARYNVTIRYRQNLTPELTREERKWVADLLKKAKRMGISLR